MVPLRNIEWELARVRQYPAVKTGTVQYREDDAGLGLIQFDFLTDELLDGEPVAEIYDAEPIIFSYPSPRLIGMCAPAVSSGRADFPRDLLHLNPTSDDTPVSICLARAGSQAIYDVHGVKGILARLSDWMADAKTQTLHEDYWDPLPMAPIVECVLGYINAKALQEHAASHPTGGYGYICADLIHGEHNSLFIQASKPVIDTEDVEQLKIATEQMQSFFDANTSRHTAVPAIFCWPPISQIESVPHFNRWVSMAELKSGINVIGLSECTEDATLKFDFLFSNDPNGDSRPDTDKQGKSSFLLIIGLWRPAKLDPTIVGLSDDDKARTLELRAYYLERPLEEKDRWSDQTVVREFLGLVPTTSEVLTSVSGEPALPDFTLLGAGALGSAILDYAVRGGTSSMTVFDNDLLLSHNIARHRAGRGNVQHKKVNVAKFLADDRSQDVSVITHDDDIVMLPQEVFTEAIQKGSAIIDATANPIVRRMLSRPMAINIPLIRTELFHQGRLGISLITQTGSPHTLNCLFQQLINLAADGHEPVKAWLKYEASRKYADEELLLGFGCKSKTTKLPAYKVDAHAVAVFAVIKSRLRLGVAPLIVLHEIDDDGLSLGTQVIPADPIITFQEDDGLGGWTVKVTQSALSTMHKQRREQAPNETGGYLFGSIDNAAMEICIVAASTEPPGTVGEPTRVQLGPWGKTPKERAFIRRTTGRLPPVGTWHSHPAGLPNASDVDWATIESFKSLDAQYGLPTLMVITGQNGDRAYVAEP